jgi:hypothetical protein
LRTHTQKTKRTTEWEQRNFKLVVKSLISEKKLCPLIAIMRKIPFILLRGTRKTKK